MYFLVFFVGLLSLLAPKASWYLSAGWNHKDAAPSKTALLIHRVTGGIMVVIAIIMFITGAGSINYNSWPNQFVNTLNTEQVESISIEGVGTIPQEEVSDVLDMIIGASAPEHNQRRSDFSYDAEFTIFFIDGSEETIYYIGDDAFLIQPQISGDVEYVFFSEELSAWIIGKQK